MITLYYTPTACSTATHIALEEAGVAYQTEIVKLWKPEAHAAYKAGINPLGTVPAVRFDDQLVTENVALLSHIATLDPEKKLWPDNLLAQTRCLSFMAWLASSVQLSRRQSRAPQRFTQDESTYGALSAAGREKFAGFLSVLDRRFKDSEWVMGGQYTVADGYALVPYHWAVIDEMDLTELPALKAFAERMLAREAVQTVLKKERSTLA